MREALAGLAALPEMQREALMRTALDGHSHEQVASALGLSEGALRGLVYRARVTLRAATTAFTPSPVIGWALGPRASASAPLIARLAETGAGGGSVGLSGMLVKSGTIAITAGALAGGIAAVHPHRFRSTSEGPSRQVLLAAAGDESPNAAIGTSQEPVGPWQSGLTDRSGTRGAVNHRPHSAGLMSLSWPVHQPGAQRHKDTHGSSPSSPDNPDPMTHHGVLLGASSDAAGHKGDSTNQASSSSNDSATSGDASKSSGSDGDKAPASEISSSDKDSSTGTSSTSLGSGSNDSQTQTSSATNASSNSGDSRSTSTGDFGSGSGDSTTDTTNSGSKDLEGSSSASGSSDGGAPSIS